MSNSNFFSSVRKLICRTTKNPNIQLKQLSKLVNKKTRKERGFISRGEMTTSHSLYTQTCHTLLFTDEELGLECDVSGGRGGEVMDCLLTGEL